MDAGCSTGGKWSWRPLPGPHSNPLFAHVRVGSKLKHPGGGLQVGIIGGTAWWAHRSSHLVSLRENVSNWKQLAQLFSSILAESQPCLWLSPKHCGLCRSSPSLASCRYSFHHPQGHLLSYWGFTDFMWISPASKTRLKIPRGQKPYLSSFNIYLQ